MISKGIILTGTHFQEIVPCGDFCVVQGERGGERMGKGREREKEGWRGKEREKEGDRGREQEKVWGQRDEEYNYVKEIVCDTEGVERKRWTDILQTAWRSLN